MGAGATGTGGQRRGRITQRSIEQVIERTDLVDLASGFTQLRAQGAESQGRCPFHDERTPSFWVNGVKGVYHCFGCGASGDAVTFVQAKQGLDFVEAIEFLADRYRVELEYEGGAAPERRGPAKRRLYELLESAAAFYEAHLWKTDEAAPVREYLAGRGISEETARAFRMGYSPEQGTLARKAAAKGFTKEEIAGAGLVTSNGRDFFRGRLMVPIIDRADRVIAFGARKLREEQFGGKYVNSPDGPLFHKKQSVFLGPAVRDGARRTGRVVVAEGYMDVIALHQAGFPESCAVMGTALTERQVVELKRLAPRAMFAFDPDAAGQVATVRALDVARANELDVRVVLLPEGEDPADVLTGPEGPERMEELLEHGVSLLRYRTNVLLGSGDLRDAGERERIWRDGLAFYATLPDSPAKRTEVDRFGAALGLDSSAIAALHGQAGTDQPMGDVANAKWAYDRDGEYRGRVHGADRHRVLGPPRPRTSPRADAVAEDERRLLASALRLAELGGGEHLAAVQLEEGALGTPATVTAWTALVEGGADALAPTRVRDDEQLHALVASLGAMAGRLNLGDDPDTARTSVDAFARKLSLAALDRQLAQLASRLEEHGADEDEGLLAEMAELKARRRAYDVRHAEPERADAE